MFIAAAKRTPVDLEDWAVQMMEKHNRKSHLAPKLSPSTQALLRGESQLSPSKESTPSTASTSTKTPTSGIIPIVEDDSRATPNADLYASQRIPSGEVNGTPRYQSQSAAFDRQGFPPRTSSNLSGPSSGRPKDGDMFSPTGSLSSHPRDSGSFNPTTTLPIRPAPPSGPLPPPPGASFRHSTSKRPVANGSSYPHSENQQY